MGGLTSREKERACCLCVHVPSRGHAWAGVEGAICKPRREVSAEPDSASASSSGFQSLNCGEILFCCLTPPTPPPPSQFGAICYSSPRILIHPGNWKWEKGCLSQTLLSGNYRMSVRVEKQRAPAWREESVGLTTPVSRGLLGPRGCHALL